jgi:hypothetical protein
MTSRVPAPPLRRISSAAPSRYQRRLAALATKHAKERALSWPLRRGLGLSLCVPPEIDTDTLGTFTGEIPRPGTPAEVVRRKARAGMDAAKLPIGIASEGSFGPHPMVPFLPADFEVLVFVDDEQGFSVSQEVVTTETNYAQQRCTNPDEALIFAKRVRFPSHALIVRPVGNPEPALILKGISDAEALGRLVQEAIDQSPDHAASVETDMRAHANPSRMRIIRHLAARLARRLRSLCPKCDCPGFGKIGAEPGLACEECGAPTGLTLREIYGCPRCQEQRLHTRADGRTAAPAQLCPECNP